MFKIGRSLYKGEWDEMIGTEILLYDHKSELLRFSASSRKCTDLIRTQQPLRANVKLSRWQAH